MSNFGILFKKELKENLFSRGKGEKRDVFSTIFILILILIIIAAFVYIALSVVKGYVTLKHESDVNFNVDFSYIRGAEMLNLLYSAFSFLLVFYILEKERRIIIDTKDRPIILRLPIKSSTIFLSKFLVIYCLSLFTSFCFILPVNIIFYFALGTFDITFIFGTLVNIIALPLFPFFIATLLLIPYNMVLRFFKEKQFITLIFYVLIIGLGFYLYNGLLDIFRQLLETGNIKFLFNADNIKLLNNLYKYNYPLNFFVNISLNINTLMSYLGVLVVLIITLAASFSLANIMFKHTLYTNNPVKNKLYHTSLKAKKPFVSLLKKEFLLTYRDNGNLFSYFAIAIAMPLMVYASFTLFKDLISNAIGLELDFVLGMLILFVFIVLTNTYSSTNISREGSAFLKSKTFPYSAKKLFLAKVTFAFIVSSIASIVSTCLIIIFGNLSVLESIIIILMGLVFTLSQILLGTKMDLNKANLVLNNYEIVKKQERTITKLVFSGLLIALVLGVLLIFGDTILPSMIGKDVSTVLVIVLALLVPLAYLVYAILFYLYRLETRFKNLVL